MVTEIKKIFDWLGRHNIAKNRISELVRHNEGVTFPIIVII